MVSADATAYALAGKHTRYTPRSKRYLRAGGIKEGAAAPSLHRWAL